MKKEIKNKKSVIVMIVAAVAAIIAIIVTSIVIGVSGPSDPVLDNPIGGIEAPKDDDKPNNDDPTPPDDPKEPDEPTVVKPVYVAPMASYTLGQEFFISDLVWSNTMKWYATHNGTDFVADKGTPVNAVFGGTVESVTYTTQNGYVVKIRQTDGYTATYMSLGSDVLVKEGDAVVGGAQIGTVSDSMQSEEKDGPHLHLEMTDENGKWVDPMSLLPAAPEK